MELSNCDGARKTNLPRNLACPLVDRLAVHRLAEYRNHTGACDVIVRALPASEQVTDGVQYIQVIDSDRDHAKDTWDPTSHHDAAKEPGNVPLVGYVAYQHQFLADRLT